MKKLKLTLATSPHLYDHLGQTDLQGKFPGRVGKSYTHRPHNKARPGTSSFNGLLTQGKFS